MKNILDYSINELLTNFDIYEELIDRHYNIETEYQKVDDIEDEEDMVEYISEILEEEFEQSETVELIAKIIYINLKDKLIEEIFDRDDNALEDEEVRREIY